MKPLKFTVQNGVKVWDPLRDFSGYTRAIRSLKKGQSVVLPLAANNVTSIVSRMGRAGGYYTVRTVKRGGLKPHARIWRMK